MTSFLGLLSLAESPQHGTKRYQLFAVIVPSTPVKCSIKCLSQTCLYMSVIPALGRWGEGGEINSSRSSLAIEWVLKASLGYIILSLSKFFFFFKAELVIIYSVSHFWKFSVTWFTPPPTVCVCCASLYGCIFTCVGISVCTRCAHMCKYNPVLARGWLGHSPDHSPPCLVKQSLSLKWT